VWARRGFKPHGIPLLVLAASPPARTTWDGLIFMPQGIGRPRDIKGAVTWATADAESGKTDGQKDTIGERIIALVS
jgi:hypothetical protein